MKRYELGIKILDKSYIDKLIIALVRQGYSVFYNEDEEKVCFNIEEEELKEI